MDDTFGEIFWESDELRGLHLTTFCLGDELRCWYLVAEHGAGVCLLGLGFSHEGNSQQISNLVQNLKLLSFLAI